MSDLTADIAHTFVKHVEPCATCGYCASLYQCINAFEDVLDRCINDIFEGDYEIVDNELLCTVVCMSPDHEDADMHKGQIIAFDIRVLDRLNNKNKQ